MLEDPFEERAAVDWMRQIDQQLGYHPDLELAEEDGERQADLVFAERLGSMDWSSESASRLSIRSRLAKRAQPNSRRGLVEQLSLRRQPGLLVVLIALVAVGVLFTYSPAAAIQRIFGYGYLPEAGFFRLSDTVLLKGPIIWRQVEGSVALWQGLIRKEEVAVWVGTSAEPSTLRDLYLIMPDGSHVIPSEVQVEDHRVKLVFYGQFEDAEPVSLASPEGWQFPLAWIPAGQAALAPTRVGTPLSTHTPEQTAEGSPCGLVESGHQVCVQAAYQDEQGTFLLLQYFINGKPSAREWSMALLSSQVVLKGSDGRVYPLTSATTGDDQDPSTVSLRFETLSVRTQVTTLYLPTQDGAEFEIPIRLPERVPVRSPTPQIIESPPAGPEPVRTPLNPRAP